MVCHDYIPSAFFQGVKKKISCERKEPGIGNEARPALARFEWEGPGYVILRGMRGGGGGAGAC